MVRYRAVVAYDGSAYAGFQRQAEGTATLQAAIEAALEQVTGRFIRISGAGRTDTGVHAAGNVIAFDHDWRHADEALLRALNATLPIDIALQSLQRVDPGFHPRFDATSRVYRYQVYNAKERNPLLEWRVWQYRGALDMDAMNAAASLIHGEHDFATFGNPTQGESTVRRVLTARWSEGTAEDAGSVARRLTFEVEANGFLHHMVRVLAGVLVDVGAGRWTVEQFAEAFAAHERGRARTMAPPQGLTLIAVKYASPSANEDMGYG